MNYLERELEEDYNARADYHSELWASEAESMRRNGEIEMEAMNDEQGA